jgi:hypothetical protein
VRILVLCIGFEQTLGGVVALFVADQFVVVLGCHAVWLGLFHQPHGFFAITIQFPAICFKGLGSLIPAAYGPKHIAVPIDAVSVGATYILITDG